MVSVFTKTRGWSAQTQFTGSASFKQKLTQIQAELDFSQNTKLQWSLFLQKSVAGLPRPSLQDQPVSNKNWRKYKQNWIFLKTRKF
jgi:hypothetical protein